MTDKALTIMIGERVRYARGAADLSLQGLSDLINKETGHFLSKARISNYEQGIRRPSIEAGAVICAALKRDLEWLMCINEAEDMAQKRGVFRDVLTKVAGGQE